MYSDMQGVTQHKIICPQMPVACYGFAALNDEGDVIHATAYWAGEDDEGNEIEERRPLFFEYADFEDYCSGIADEFHILVSALESQHPKCKVAVGYFQGDVFFSCFVL